MKEFEKEIIFYKILNKIILGVHNAQAYILVGNDVEYLKDKALLLAKAFICPFKYEIKCTKCNICKRIEDMNFSELKIINPINRTIKKELILDIKNSFQTNSIEGKNQVYIINEVELLNQSAANSILKFLEEPDSNTIAIFTTTNIDSVINTISSRCQIIRLKGEKKQKNNELIFEYCNLNNENFETAFNFFIDVEKNKNKSVINIKDKFLNHFNTKEGVNSVLKLFILIYKDILNYKLVGNFENFDNNFEIKNIADSQSNTKIIKKILYVLENIKKIEYNVNIMLFINNLLIGIGEISDDKCSRN